MRGLEWIHVLENGLSETPRELRLFADSTIMFPELVHDRWSARGVADVLEKKENTRAIDVRQSQ